MPANQNADDPGRGQHWKNGADSERSNQNIHCLFPFTFRELNLLGRSRLHLVELLQLFFTQALEAGSWGLEDLQLLFIFDGLDECRLPLDFRNNETVTDIRRSTSSEGTCFLLFTSGLPPDLQPPIRSLLIALT